MLLPDHEIERLCYLQRADVVNPQPRLIDPFDRGNLQPASYDLSLERQFCFPGPNNSPFVAKAFMLHPGEMVLGCTRERLQLPDWLAGQVDGRSGNARRGLQIEAAGHVDPGYVGVITLEIVNLSKQAAMLSAGMGIAKISFLHLLSPCRVPYNAERNRHQFAHGPIPS